MRRLRLGRPVKRVVGRLVQEVELEPLAIGDVEQRPGRPARAPSARSAVRASTHRTSPPGRTMRCVQSTTAPCRARARSARPRPSRRSSGMDAGPERLGARLDVAMRDPRIALELVGPRQHTGSRSPSRSCRGGQSAERRRGGDGRPPDRSGAAAARRCHRTIAEAPTISSRHRRTSARSRSTPGARSRSACRRTVSGPGPGSPAAAPPCGSRVAPRRRPPARCAGCCCRPSLRALQPYELLRPVVPVLHDASASVLKIASATNPDDGRQLLSALARALALGDVGRDADRPDLRVVVVSTPACW